MMEKLSSLIGPERERIQNHNWDCAIFSYGAEANPCSHFGRLAPARQVVTTAARSGGRSMQSLMNDQPQPACSRPENNSAERSNADHCGAKH